MHKGVALVSTLLWGGSHPNPAIFTDVNEQRKCCKETLRTAMSLLPARTSPCRGEITCVHAVTKGMTEHQGRQKENSQGQAGGAPAGKGQWS